MRPNSLVQRMSQQLGDLSQAVEPQARASSPDAEIKH
jgi:hypothetical protein